MKYDMQADALYIELSNIINRFVEEFDLNPYTIVGVLDAKKTDILIGVKTSKKTIINRLKKRGNYNKKIFDILKAQQLNINKKLNMCDFIIENNSSKNHVLKKIKNIKKKLND